MDNEDGPNQPKDQPHDEALPPEPKASPPSKTDKPKGSSGPPEENKNPPAESARKITWLEYVLAATNTALVLVGIIAAVIYNGQLESMNAQLSAMNASISENRLALRQYLAQTKAAQVSANAAQKSVSAVSRQMRQDQRPWLRVEFVPTPGSDPAAGETTVSFIVGTPISFIVRIRNSGKTPAIDAISNFTMEILGVNDPMALPTEHGVSKRIYSPRSIFRPPPGAPPSGRPKEVVPATHSETGIIFPETFTGMNLTSLAIDKGQIVPAPLLAEEASDIRAGIRQLYVVGRIEYLDEFGALHWTDYCRAVTIGPQNFRCDRFNSVDGN